MASDIHRPLNSTLVLPVSLGYRQREREGSSGSESFVGPEVEVCKARDLPKSVEVPKLEKYHYSMSVSTAGTYSPLPAPMSSLSPDQEKAITSRAVLRAVRNDNLSELHRLLSSLSPREQRTCLGLRTVGNESLLHVACRNASLEMCEELVSRGLGEQVDVVNDAGETPLHTACSHNRLSHAELLLSAGADIDKSDISGNTPLHSATSARHFELAYFLKLKGANPRLRNKAGNSAVECPARKTLAELKDNIRGNGRKSTTPMTISTSTLAVPKLSDYRVCNLLGKGSFGRVYLVQERASARQFALKVIKKSTLTARRLYRYAFTERNVLCRVTSPFIVRLHAAFQTSKYLLLLLDYCPGGDLGHYLTREKRFSESKTRHYLCEIILALEELHRKHIIYRDLKPDNVLLAADGHICITDFGLAKEDVGDNRAAQSFCGSMGYIAPEMLKKEGHGQAADWYMLGVMTYELLTGNLPFYHRDREVLLRNIEKNKPFFPSRLSAAAISLITKVIPI